jgi:hypothetical protein
VLCVVSGVNAPRQDPHHLLLTHAVPRVQRNGPALQIATVTHQSTVLESTDPNSGQLSELSNALKLHL